MFLSLKDKIRFDQKVKKIDSCWEWIASTFWNGYGIFNLNGKNLKAHKGKEDEI